MVMFFRARECSQSFRRRSSVIVLRISISCLSRASVWTWVTHKLEVSSVMLVIWTCVTLVCSRPFELICVLTHFNGLDVVIRVPKDKFTVMNLQVLYLQVVNTDVTAESVIDSSHCPINFIEFLSQPAQLAGSLPETKTFHLYSLRSRFFTVVINVHLSWTSWLWSQVEVRDASELKPVMFLSAELLRKDSLSSSCTR